MKETEIRFAVPHDLDAAVTAHLGAFDGEPEQTRTVYFDTPDHKLWLLGVECRIRRNGSGFHQTVKTRVPGSPAFVRNKDEIAIDAEEPSLAHLDATLPAGLRDGIDISQIRPVFHASLRRQVRTLVAGGNEIRVVHDFGRIYAENKFAEIDDVEYELEKGDSGSLAHSCLDFLETAPCGLQVRSKSARGYELATGLPPVPVHAEKLRISPDTTMPEAIATMMRASFAQAIANQPALMETLHPESVHQMRVGLRRLRTALSAFGPVLDLADAGDLVDEAKRIFRRLGDIREADVFEAGIIDTIPVDMFGDRRRATLLREVHRFRDLACADMVDLVKGPGFARFAVRWYGWIERGNWLSDRRPADRRTTERPVGEFAAPRLAEMQSRLIKRGRKALKGGFDDWHRARIAAKKLRYAGESLRPVLSADKLGNGKRRHTKRLSRLQDELGRFTDLTNAGGFLGRVRTTVPRRNRAAFDEAAAFCTGWTLAQASATVPRLERKWNEFERAVGGRKS